MLETTNQIFHGFSRTEPLIQIESGELLRYVEVTSVHHAVEAHRIPETQGYLPTAGDAGHNDSTKTPGGLG